MLSWKEIVQNYIIKHSNKVTKTTRPLRDHFGIGYFPYHRIDNKGKYTVLLDRPDWAERYVSDQIYLMDPYLRHPSVYKSGITRVDSHGSEEYKERTMDAANEVLEMNMGAMLIEKSEDGVEFFGFSANSQTSALEDLYLNHQGLLKSFASHFKNELNPVLYEMEQEASSLITLKGKDFFEEELIHPAISVDTYLSYLQHIGLNEMKNAKKLSSRGCVA